MTILLGFDIKIISTQVSIYTSLLESVSTYESNISAQILYEVGSKQIT